MKPVLQDQGKVILLILFLTKTVQPSWWYLGLLSSSQTDIPSPSSEKEDVDCSNFKFLAPRQKELCSREAKLLKVIGEGASRGITECQNQFANRRWNCTTFNTTNVFGKVLQLKTRETAYIYAIQSAGIMYAVTKACARGELERCGCDTKVRQKDTHGAFEWGGCSENTRYGAKFSQEFVDTNEHRTSGEGLMNLWNNEAGRKAAKSQMDLVCKCHGVSGSCSVKICWKKIRNFRAIGKFLKEKFDGASLVQFINKKRKLKRINRDMKKPTKKDLVYLQESPDFCNNDPRFGSLGTQGRKCNKTSYGLDGCTLMCCGRGYYTTVKVIKEDCNCKFVWCCRVDCDKCTYEVEENYCN
nr:putative Wnt family member 4 [Geukensia demissa]